MRACGAAFSQDCRSRRYGGLRAACSGSSQRGDLRVSRFELILWKVLADFDPKYLHNSRPFSSKKVSRDTGSSNLPCSSRRARTLGARRGKVAGSASAVRHSLARLARAGRLLVRVSFAGLCGLVPRAPPGSIQGSDAAVPEIAISAIIGVINAPSAAANAILKIRK